MPKKIKMILIIITNIILFLVNAVHAQDNSETATWEDSDLQDELRFLRVEMVSIATGTQQSISRAPAVTSVITAQDIKMMGATNLEDVLETVPGLHVARSSIGYMPIYIFRGIYTVLNPQVLMLVNGISIDTLYTGNRGQTFSNMPVNAIARIEVIRGPSSAAFGADAFAGVINIITKTKDDIDGTEVGARLGSFNTHEVWSLHGGEVGGIDIALALEYYHTDGQREIIEADAQTSFDAQLGTNASLAPGSVNLSRQNFNVHFDASKDMW